MTTVATSDLALGRTWGSGNFTVDDALRLRIRRGRHVGARLIGSLQVAHGLGDDATVTACERWIEATRRLPEPAREWLLTHPVTSDAIRILIDRVSDAKARGTPIDLEAWLEDRFATLIRGATLVAGEVAAWEARSSRLLPGIGLRLPAQAGQRIEIGPVRNGRLPVRIDAQSFEVPTTPAVPRQWMAVNHEFALPSFVMSGVRVHVDAEDPAFTERWVPAARFGPLSVAPAYAATMPRWVEELEAASRVAEATVPLSASLFGQIVRTVVPIVSPDASMGCSLSDRELPGAIMTTTDGPAVLAENLLHEFRHNLLHQLEQSYPLYLADSPSDARFYSPWRDDLRPLHGILHALFVFLDVCAVHAGVRAGRLGDDSDMHDSAVRLAANVLRIGIALKEFRRHARTTEFGSGFVQGIEEAVARFLPIVDGLPGEAVAEAAEQVELHRRAVGAVK